MKQTLAATAAILTFMLVLVSPTGATGDDSPLGDADTSIDLPDDVERHTSKAMRANAMRQPIDDDLRRWPCFFGFGSCHEVEPDTGYLDCADVTVDEIGITWSANDGYDSIHVVPTDQGRVGSLLGPSATITGASTIYAEMHLCLNRHNLSVTVRSWSAMWQQIHCHIVFQILGGGGSWDLEGHRSSNWSGYLRPGHWCSW